MKGVGELARRARRARGLSRRGGREDGTTSLRDDDDVGRRTKLASDDDGGDATTRLFDLAARAVQLGLVRERTWRA